VLTQAIGEMLPAALAVTLSPFPIIAIVLLLGTTQARRNGFAFMIGWIIGLAALTAVVMLLITTVDDHGSAASRLVSWARVLGGAGLIALAWRKWTSRPREGVIAVPPAWMSRISTSTPARSVVLGLVLAGLNVKNLALVTSGTSSITDLGIEGHQAVVAAAIFVFLGSLSVIVAMLVHVIGGERSVAPLEAVKQFMIANNNVIMMIILLILGAKILGDGISGLSV
jgi:threonine/homoserine/homoserine lactone efflux protein